MPERRIFVVQSRLWLVDSLFGVLVISAAPLWWYAFDATISSIVLGYVGMLSLVVGIRLSSLFAGSMGLLSCEVAALLLDSWEFIVLSIALIYVVFARIGLRTLLEYPSAGGIGPLIPARSPENLPKDMEGKPDTSE